LGDERPSLRRRSALAIFSVMLRGHHLYRETPPPWSEGGGFLLLNPRLPVAWRESVLAAKFPDLPRHVWLASSGTGGTLKIIALSRDAVEASAQAALHQLAVTSKDVWINPLPLFHAGGFGMVVRAALSGTRLKSFRRWDAPDFAQLASECGATLTSLVPTQVQDLVEAGVRAPRSLRAAVVGGGPLPEALRLRGDHLGWPLLPSYGLTEAASQVATALPEAGHLDWLPLLSHLTARSAATGVLELRGASLLTGWLVFSEDGSSRWEDPKSSDGWLRSSDRAEVRGREIRVLGRIDDLVKIRGELVDLGALERAVQDRVTGGDVCLQARPDQRNGFVLSLLVSNAAAAGQATEALEIFPAFARPVSVEVGVVHRNALGKVVRTPRH